MFYWFEKQLKRIVLIFLAIIILVNFLPDDKSKQIVSEDVVVPVENEEEIRKKEENRILVEDIKKEKELQKLQINEKWLKEINKVPTISSVDIQGNALVVFPDINFPKMNYTKLVNLLCVNAQEQEFVLVRMMDTNEYLTRGKYKIFKRYMC